MNLLCRHIALCQQEYFLFRSRMNRDIYYNDSMTGRTAFIKTSPGCKEV